MIRLATVALMLATGPTWAQDFSAGSQANSWGLNGEAKALFAARVTDAVCALTGDCPADCGDGARQMVLIRAADDVMLLATKNNQPVFSGATHDLAPWCGRDVEMDGLLIGDPEVTPGLRGRIFQVQRIRGAEEADWTAANRFTEAWAERHPEAAGEGQWFERDPAIQAEIARNGRLGLGAEADAAYAEDNF